MKPLTKRDKRTLKWSAIAAAAIVGWFVLIEPTLDGYHALRSEHSRLKKELDQLTGIRHGIGAIRYKELAERVPKFELPQDAAQQGVLFRDELTRQLQKAGLQARTVQMRDSRGKRQDGFAVLTVDCQGRGGYEPMLKLLADLKQNPYYVGIEKFSLRVDAKNRNEITFQLTAFTYAR